MAVALAAASVIGAGLAACTHSTVQPEHEAKQADLLQPSVVLVYKFIGAQRALGAGRKARGAGDQDDEHTPQVAQEVSDVFADELVKEINGLGLPARRATRRTHIPANALVVSGHFVNIDAGNRVGRLVIGFGAGQASVDAQVQVLARGTKGLRTVLEFKTHADSGELPGAAATMGAGAAVEGGVTASMAAANAVVGGIKAHRTALGALAARSADRATEYLSKFFGDQNWIPPEKIEQAPS
jgi:hypothetical protein